jgi:hypothetical protein
VIFIVGKFDDASVPAQVPEISAKGPTGPGAGEDGEGVSEVGEPH